MNKDNMHILGISGSPRKNGNTAYAVQYALEVLQKQEFTTRYLSLAGRNIEPCIGCWRCEEDRECWMEDDMDEIIDAMRWCQGLIIGSPVYFGLLSGQLKVMMDRCIVLRPSYDGIIEMSGKIGGAIACANFRNGGQEITLQNIQTFFLQNNMKAISDGQPYSHSGATIVKDAKDDELGLQTVSNMALNIARMLTK